MVSFFTLSFYSTVYLPSLLVTSSAEAVFLVLGGSRFVPFSQSLRKHLYHLFARSWRLASLLGCSSRGYGKGDEAIRVADEIYLAVSADAHTQTNAERNTGARMDGAICLKK